MRRTQKSFAEDLFFRYLDHLEDVEGLSSEMINELSWRFAAINTIVLIHEADDIEKIRFYDKVLNITQKHFKTYEG